MPNKLRVTQISHKIMTVTHNVFGEELICQGVVFTFIKITPHDVVYWYKLWSTVGKTTINSSFTLFCYLEISWFWWLDLYNEIVAFRRVWIRRAKANTPVLKCKVTKLYRRSNFVERLNSPPAVGLIFHITLSLCEKWKKEREEGENKG